MDEVWELHGVAHEKNRRVVAHQIPVALFGVELESKTAHVAPGIGIALLAGHLGKAQ